MLCLPLFPFLIKATFRETISAAPHWSLLRLQATNFYCKDVILELGLK